MTKLERVILYVPKLLKPNQSVKQDTSCTVILPPIASSLCPFTHREANCLLYNFLSGPAEKVLCLLQSAVDIPTKRVPVHTERIDDHVEVVGQQSDGFTRLADILHPIVDALKWIFERANARFR